MGKKVSILNYGCTANHSHGEIIAGTLKEHGFIVVGEPKESEVIIINSCIVKSVTENRIKSKIIELTRKHPQKLIILTGCGADAEYGTFRKINKNMIFVSSHHVNDIIEAIEEKKDFLGIRKEDKLLKPKKRKNEIVNIVEISQGCLGNCTFCITKNARGKLESYDSDKIVREIEKSLNEGCKEIWLTSQDCGCYGLDTKENLCTLLEKIGKIEGNFRVRIGMSNPQFIRKFPEELSRILKDDKFFKFLHIPVQSGSDKILRLMKRGHTVGDFKKIINAMRINIPDITISTDIIVGFPEETEADFKESVKLLRDANPDIINISKFGARPGTEAKTMKQIDSKKIKERTVLLGEVAEKIKKEKNKYHIGKAYTILIDEHGKRKNQMIGRSENYKPVIIETEDELMGRFVNVKIKEAKETHLLGEIISE
ncbi:MAG: tRNA (N(6)-L-threonylcarbamoyladenosine(37)-C(2))-methylthiotransferase [Candidatus Aenigmarchaeota archaeon]|nr:tRNA (N(6)-L-threonylcarbamoyladenosine(37)-C(2))-methylthiotransferase [Candidatus Aenigmarchaeota archaeon]